MRRFGELEAVIMDCLWTWRRPVTAREVERHLRTRREIAYTTVTTVMENLHRKGWLRRHREGRAYVYQPVHSREDYAARLMHEALVLSTDHGTTFAHFLHRISAEESRALTRALNQLRREHGR
ncbi:hypothetical protein GCM10012275_19780 [Longimycelium tulufanense]|uniref:BlaI/MecI/CopY family transcriptional regulator n=1 Tax=Longimycelium tulufanense TaxID=907463 RepID=A0A8J3FVZ2_9PSEU|nr:BlaI/MecI/CopY family transcriptional regulator [Longimycelium tulufanense]GGM48910.1 hypothetical protein GCM10012275_19780 [Longimycelium tulufanense]